MGLKKYAAGSRGTIQKYLRCHHHLIVCRCLCRCLDRTLLFCYVGVDWRPTIRTRCRSICPKLLDTCVTDLVDVIVKWLKLSRGMRLEANRTLLGMNLITHIVVWLCGFEWCTIPKIWIINNRNCMVMSFNFIYQRDINPFHLEFPFPMEYNCP